MLGREAERGADPLAVVQYILDSVDSFRGDDRVEAELESVTGGQLRTPVDAPYDLLRRVWDTRHALVGWYRERIQADDDMIQQLELRQDPFDEDPVGAQEQRSELEFPRATNDVLDSGIKERLTAGEIECRVPRPNAVQQGQGIDQGEFRFVARWVTITAPEIAAFRDVEVRHEGEEQTIPRPHAHHIRGEIAEQLGIGSEETSLSPPRRLSAVHDLVQDPELLVAKRFFSLR